MMRRLKFAFLFLIIFANVAWPKWKEEEQKYLDDQFNAIRDQVQALKAQVEALSARVAELQQNQVQLQTVIGRQLHTLQETEQLVTSLRLGSEENFSSLKSTITQLRNDTQKSFNALAGLPAPGVPGTTEVPAAVRPGAPAPATPQVVQGYITIIDGNTVTVDLGSAKGIRQGSRLAVYKATDPTARVGLLEVTQVVDRENSKAQIVTMNPGVKPEFSDIVRLE